MTTFCNDYLQDSTTNDSDDFGIEIPDKQVTYSIKETKHSRKISWTGEKAGWRFVLVYNSCWWVSEWLRK